MNKNKSCKVNFELFAIYTKAKTGEDDCMITDLKSFNAPFQIITAASDLNEMCIKMFDKLLKKSEEFQERDSGWALFALSHLMINFNKHQPIRGGTYIPLPREINLKRACINLVNNDDA